MSGIGLSLSGGIISIICEYWSSNECSEAVFDEATINELIVTIHFSIGFLDECSPHAVVIGTLTSEEKVTGL